MPLPPPPYTQNEPSSIATPKTKEEFDALPDGAFYIEPEDGHVYQKGNKTRPQPKQPARGTLV